MLGQQGLHGGKGENRTHIAGFSDRCIDQLCYLPVERETGFEPAAFSLARRRSTTDLLSRETREQACLLSHEVKEYEEAQALAEQALTLARQVQF